jgi:phospholipase A2
MKRFKVHIFCTIVACAFLIIVRGTRTVDYAEKLREWKNAAVVALRQRYDEAKMYVGREVISPVLVKVIKSQEKSIINNPYQNTVAQVRIGNQLHPEELAYRANRQPKVKVALENLLGRSLDDKKIPVIAFVGSGGGYRAMLCTTGFLVGAEKIGLLNTATYITALSGSTWMLGPWFATGWSCANFRIYLEGVVIQSIFKVDALAARQIADVFATKLAFNQPITTVDLFGALLANRLLDGFGDNKQMLYLSQQAERVKDGNWPYPIYTATDGSEKVWHGPHWYEFTPHEIGSAAFEVYVPSWAYGREFFGGKSLDFAPEQTLGFLMGTFGSAYALHVGFMWNTVVENISNVLLKQLIEQYIIQEAGGKRVFWAEINNYMKGMENIPNAYERLETRNALKLVDAGLTFNLPYPPVSGERSERKADVLIMLDSSADKIADELKKTERYARDHGLKFPVIDYTDIDKKTISIFKDETDISVPVVIYMPRISDTQLWQENKMKSELSQYTTIEAFNLEACTNEGGVCRTLNFEYAAAEAQQVMDQTEFNMVVNKDKIIEALNWVIDRQAPGASVVPGQSVAQ